MRWKRAPLGHNVGGPKFGIGFGCFRVLHHGSEWWLGPGCTIEETTILGLDPGPQPSLSPWTPDPTAGLLWYDDEPLTVEDVHTESPYWTSIDLSEGISATVFSWQHCTELLLPEHLDRTKLTAEDGKLRRCENQRRVDWYPRFARSPLIRLVGLDEGEIRPTTLWKGPRALGGAPCWFPHHELARGNHDLVDKHGWVDVVGHPGHQILASAVLYRPGGEPNPPEYYRWPRPGASPGLDAVDLRVTFRRRFNPEARR